MKYAMTMDGKIAAFTGASKWVTGETARSHVQQQRHRFRGIMVGVGTVLADDPLLTCRMENGRNPVRVICDTHLRTPPQAQVVATADQIPTILATCCADPERQAVYQRAGCQVLCLNEENGHVDLRQLMERLGREQIDSILLEGGGTLNWAALECGIVQQVQAYIAPKLFGGRDAKTPCGGRGRPRPGRRLPLEKQPAGTAGRGSSDRKRGGISVFTGIVEEVGAIKNIKRGQHSAVLTIQAKTVLEETRIGDSIAVNGICLTVTRLFPDGFSADVMHETLNRSSLAGLTAGSVVNLERAMPANGRFGGHIVAGHVDGVGHIANIRRDDTAVWYTVHAGPEILRYVVEKGSITIDGISLTVAAVDGEGFSVSTIPHTVAQTNLSQRRRGDPVNLETDVVGKYIEKLLRPEEPKPHTPANESTLTKEMLLRCGF